jgi:hypothetical protein
MRYGGGGGGSGGGGGRGGGGGSSKWTCECSFSNRATNVLCGGGNPQYGCGKARAGVGMVKVGSTKARATLCVSSQVGCKMGCTFCATGTMGLSGNLTAGEILEQLVRKGVELTLLCLPWSPAQCTSYG